MNLCKLLAKISSTGADSHSVEVKNIERIADRFISLHLQRFRLRRPPDSIEQISCIDSNIKGSVTMKTNLKQEDSFVSYYSF